MVISISKYDLIDKLQQTLGSLADIQNSRSNNTRTTTRNGGNKNNKNKENTSNPPLPTTNVKNISDTTVKEINKEISNSVNNLAHFIYNTIPVITDQAQLARIRLIVSEIIKNMVDNQSDNDIVTNIMKTINDFSSMSSRLHTINENILKLITTMGYTPAHNDNSERIQSLTDILNKKLDLIENLEENIQRLDVKLHKQQDENIDLSNELYNLKLILDNTTKDYNEYVDIIQPNNVKLALVQALNVVTSPKENITQPPDNQTIEFIKILQPYVRKFTIPNGDTSTNTPNSTLNFNTGTTSEQLNIPPEQQPGNTQQQTIEVDLIPTVQQSNERNLIQSNQPYVPAYGLPTEPTFEPPYIPQTEQPYVPPTTEPPPKEAARPASNSGIGQVHPGYGPGSQINDINTHYADFISDNAVNTPPDKFNYVTKLSDVDSMQVEKTPVKRKLTSESDALETPAKQSQKDNTTTDVEEDDDDDSDSSDEESGGTINNGQFNKELNALYCDRSDIDSDFEIQTPTVNAELLNSLATEFKHAEINILSPSKLIVDPPEDSQSSLSCSEPKFPDQLLDALNIKNPPSCSKNSTTSRDIDTDGERPTPYRESVKFKNNLKQVDKRSRKKKTTDDYLQ